MSEKEPVIEATEVTALNAGDPINAGLPTGEWKGEISFSSVARVAVQYCFSSVTRLSSAALLTAPPHVPSVSSRWAV